ncbi:hypothetical protein HGM15179_016316 [Zosterops borbonicus]|uniref:Retroviral nucleocapsid Gag protein p24 C-terminal domain-containing protein n=1 Tax=Zosterops borbonicus TaxID=364589 RepID=A0A8K1G319_9PASS|nr:hypothetical protein HGM15179_016316 [Zosterops borbonicus]
MSIEYADSDSSSDRESFDPSPEKDLDPFPPKTHKNWLQIKKKALRDRDFETAAKIFVAPVQLGPRGGNLRWEPLSHSEIKELCRTVIEYGLGSPYFSNLLRAIFSTHLMTPHDVKFLANLLLTPTQYAIFMAQWKKRLENLILTHAGHANQALAALTADQLAGEGAHTDPNAQAPLPREALEGVTEAARYALFKVPDAKTLQQSFINFKQAPQEPYMQFVDRLKQTLERQINNNHAREVVLLKLAIENANEDCKCLLKTLPSDPEPTLLQIVEACNRLGTLHYTTAVTCQAVGQGLAAKKALSQLNKAACWLAKQKNATSSALSNLLTDVDSVKHASLQNRAAIDFILLAQGHGCEDFDGMCCMNLSDHSESIHKSIQLLKDSVFKLKASTVLNPEAKRTGQGPLRETKTLANPDKNRHRNPDSEIPLQTKRRILCRGIHIEINVGRRAPSACERIFPEYGLQSPTNPGRPSKRNLDYLAHPGHLDCLRAEKSYKTVD